MQSERMVIENRQTGKQVTRGCRRSPDRGFGTGFLIRLQRWRSYAFRLNSYRTLFKEGIYYLYLFAESLGKLEAAMWYVIQTMTGKEEELITLIRTILKEDLYTNCFVMKAEWMKRLGGEWNTQIRTLFPGYVFIDTEQPDEVFLELKQIPRFSKMLGTGKFEFTSVKKEEQEFLELISEIPIQTTNELMSDYNTANYRIVRLTDVIRDENGTIVTLNGTLQYFKKDIVKINFHKRFAVVKTDLFSLKQTLVFGIRLGKDIS